MHTKLIDAKKIEQTHKRSWDYNANVVTEN